MPVKTYYIYSLKDTYDQQLYYVGCTTKLTFRSWQHSRLNEAELPQKQQRTQRMIDAGLVPQVDVLDTITTEHKQLARRLEACWQCELFNAGNPILIGRFDGLVYNKSNPKPEIERIKSFAGADLEQLTKLLDTELDEELQANARLVHFPHVTQSKQDAVT